MRQYRHGGREDTGLVHVAALLTDSLFYGQGRVGYDSNRENGSAGMSRDCAAETAMWYMAQGDDEGLEDYVTALEAGREARQYGVS